MALSKIQHKILGRIQDICYNCICMPRLYRYPIFMCFCNGVSYSLYSAVTLFGYISVGTVYSVIAGISVPLAVFINFVLLHKSYALKEERKISRRMQNPRYSSRCQDGKDINRNASRRGFDRRRFASRFIYRA